MKSPTFLCVFVQQSFNAVDASCAATEYLFIESPLLDGVFFSGQQRQIGSAVDTKPFVAVGDSAAL